jgi:hypothetical protein
MFWPENLILPIPWDFQDFNCRVNLVDLQNQSGLAVGAKFSKRTLGKNLAGAHHGNVIAELFNFS